MRLRSWLTLLLVAAMLLTTNAAPALGQYAQGLPPGVVSLEVDGQPIDAVSVPETDNPSPQIAGQIDTGAPAVDLGIGDGNGEIVRFSLEANQRGRFRGTPPQPLAPGQYALYVFDTLAGSFIVTGEGTPTTETVSSVLDVSRVIPFPFDFGDAMPGLGLLEGRFYSLDEEAQRTAAASGDDSRENVEATRESLIAAGWQQRYEARLAVPSPDDPTQFVQQVTAFVIEYAEDAQAQAAFAASVGAPEAVPGATVGTESEMALLQGTTPDTGVDYQALRLLYRQDRLLGVIIVADLSGAPPDQPLLEQVGQQVAARGAAVLAGQVNGVGPRTLRLEVPGSAQITINEAYQAVDGVLVAAYNEDATGQAAREATFAGANEAFANSFIGSVPPRGRNRDATPEAAEAPSAQGVAYSATLYDFPTPEDADAWMTGLPDRLASDPMRGYLAFAPAADAPVYGDASATYAFQRRVGDATVAGFRVYARLGAEVAQVEYAGAPEATLADAEQLVNAQLDCLRAGACPTPAAIPSAGDEDQGGGRNRERRERDGEGGVQDVGAPANETPAADEGAPAEAPPAEEPVEEPTEEPSQGGVRDISDQS